MITWTINYSNDNKGIEKRLLCQPKTFSLLSTPNQVNVTIHTSSGRQRLTEVLTEVVLEMVFMEEAVKHMTQHGYTEPFIHSYLSKDLINEMLQTSWRTELERAIEDDLVAIEESGNHLTWELDVFSRFQTHAFRQSVTQFMTVCDDEIKNQLANLSTKALKNMKDEQSVNNEESSKVDLVREGSDLVIFVDGEVVGYSHDMKERFKKLFTQSAYKEDSTLYREYVEIALFTFMAIILPIKTYVIDVTERALVHSLKRSLLTNGIQTTIETVSSESE